LTSFSFDGFEIAFEERGHGRAGQDRPFILIHGLLFARTHHYPLADALAARGNRVVLIDLLGHGESDKPPHSRHYSMEIFGRQVLALMDHLGIEEAVVGGTSLGANVTLEVANRSPGRTRAMFLEMPVLERAAPVAAMFFLPLTIGYAQGAPLIGAAARLMRRIPRGMGLYPDILLELLSRDPVPSAAVLHGLLTGRLAPHPDERQKLDVPALIMGHPNDLLHPFSDVEALGRELPNHELMRSKSFLELRFPPNRLSDRIADFLDEVWA
jgi:Predicted hydrolases or acyltransferases (alpha/beta hydrolase superfamily)